MRTTLTIDDDVLTAAKRIARQTNRTVGDVISGLVRDSPRPVPVLTERNGIPLLSTRAGGVTVTPDLVTALRDELP